MEVNNREDRQSKERYSAYHNVQVVIKGALCCHLLMDSIPCLCRDHHTLHHDCPSINPPLSTSLQGIAVHMYSDSEPTIGSEVQKGTLIPGLVYSLHTAPA